MVGLSGRSRKLGPSNSYGKAAVKSKRVILEKMIPLWGGVFFSRADQGFLGAILRIFLWRPSSACAKTLR